MAVIYNADHGLEIENNLKNTFIHFRLQMKIANNDDFNIIYGTYPKMLKKRGRKVQQPKALNRRPDRRGVRRKTRVNEMSMKEFDEVLRQETEKYKHDVKEKKNEVVIKVTNYIPPPMLSVNHEHENEANIIHELRYFMGINRSLRENGDCKLYAAGGLYQYCNLIKRTFKGELNELFHDVDVTKYMDKIKEIWRAVHFFLCICNRGKRKRFVDSF